ncbi:hypothetical protein Bca4012_052581 [Brassica carinata]
MLGKSCEMIRSGASCLQLKMMEAPRRGSVGMFHIQLALKQASSKKTAADGKELSQFQTMWSLKKEDLALKERLSKMKLLDGLHAKEGPLPDYEEALKKKLIDELMSI